MSTAGKVLVVLVTLSLLVWIALFAGVARLNSEWGQKVIALDNQIQSLQTKVVDVDQKLDEARTQTRAIQTELNWKLIEVRSNLSDAEKTLTETGETVSRYKHQLAQYTDAEKDAQLALKRRNMEHNQAKQALAQEQGRVAEFKVENGRLLEEFASLQKNFQETLAKNAEMLKQISDAGRRRTKQTASR